MKNLSNVVSKAVAEAFLRSVARCPQFSRPAPTDPSLPAVLRVQSHLLPLARLSVGCRASNAR